MRQRGGGDVTERGEERRWAGKGQLNQWSRWYRCLYFNGVSILNTYAEAKGSVKIPSKSSIITYIESHK